MSKFAWEEGEIEITKEGLDTGEAFIVERKPNEVRIQYGSATDDGNFTDGHAVVKRGEKFFNWTFRELQATDSNRIVYKDS